MKSQETLKRPYISTFEFIILQITNGKPEYDQIRSFS